MTTQQRQRVRLSDTPPTEPAASRDDPNTAPPAKRTAWRTVWRPKNVTTEVIENITMLIERGLPLDGICDYLSIDHSTFYNWKIDGEEYLKANSPKENKPYGDLVLAVKSALAAYRLKLVRNLHSINNEEWRRELAILERRDRRNFGRKDPFGGAADQSPPPDVRFL